MRANDNGARQMLESGLVQAARLPRLPTRATPTVYRRHPSKLDPCHIVSCTPPKGSLCYARHRVRGSKIAHNIPPLISPSAHQVIKVVIFFVLGLSSRNGRAAE